MNRRKQSAGCFVIRGNESDIELLMMYREWPNGAKGWILPKGNVDKDETLEECALRETAEETGYTDIELIKKLDVETYLHPEQQLYKDVHWYLAKAKSDAQQAPEHTESESSSYIEIHWKKLDEALNLLEFEHNKDTLKIIMREVSQLK